MINYCLIVSLIIQWLRNYIFPTFISECINNIHVLHWASVNVLINIIETISYPRNTPFATLPNDRPYEEVINTCGYVF